ncbi:hypothetical protein HOLleu_43769 [Holothuria leucospilota]|uniref:Uncharacterized protein n=1 Tax=Holothuria leucospilota TaxID=206669 RepID=A0A9Q0Y9A9_HOLLE|nr:hypothetical protein HOLleu_43769 [Holothuria leucospilota]
MLDMCHPCWDIISSFSYSEYIHELFVLPVLEMTAVKLCNSDRAVFEYQYQTMKRNLKTYRPWPCMLIILLMCMVDFLCYW